MAGETDSFCCVTRFVFTAGPRLKPRDLHLFKGTFSSLSPADLLIVNREPRDTSDTPRISQILLIAGPCMSAAAKLVFSDLIIPPSPLQLFIFRVFQRHIPLQDPRHYVFPSVYHYLAISLPNTFTDCASAVGHVFSSDLSLFHASMSY